MIPTGPITPVEPPGRRTDIVQTEGASPTFSLAWVIYVLLGVVDALIAIRFVFKALVANTSAPFTGFVYAVTNALVWPFHGIFPTRMVSNGGILEFSSLIAIVVYALLAWAIVRLAAIPGRQRRTTTRTSS
jgi:uncharacterized protein YggT (Ycf19 family)